MYKDFAYIYDKLSFDLAYEKYAQNIQTLVEENNIEKDTMLELACGTGRLTQYFFGNFKKIHALDLSKEMLEVFKAKFVRDDIIFYQEDMVNFSNPNSYDLIVILLDSINYLRDEKDLEKLLENSYKNLKKGGLLVFDLNSLYKMEEIFGNETYVYEYQDVFYTWENEKDHDEIFMYLNFFLEDEKGDYRRIEERQVQKIYEPKKVKDILGQIGFKEIETFDEDEFTRVKEDTLRILFKARKK